MWNMMCDVMPTISEDSISQRSSQFGDDANFEQLMVSMLDERDKLVDSLKNEQEKTGDLEGKVKDLEKEIKVGYFYLSKYAIRAKVTFVSIYNCTFVCYSMKGTPG